MKSHSIQAEIVDPVKPAQPAGLFRALRPGSFFLADAERIGSRNVLVSDGRRVLNWDEKGKTGSYMDSASIFDFGNVTPMLFFVASYMEPGLLRQMEAPSYCGLANRNGRTFRVVKCAATQERGIWTLFFGPEGVLEGVESAAFHSGGNQAYAEQAWLSKIRFDKPLDAGAFNCSPPSGFQMTTPDSPVWSLPAVHSLAPSFAMPTVDGKTVSLESLLKGKRALLLNITFAECGACVLEMPTLKRLHVGLKDKGFALLAVNILDTRQEAQRVIAKYHLPYPVGLDSKVGGGTADVGTRYHADAGGLNILIGPDKKIVWLEAGLNEKHLRCVLDRMGIPALPR